jgi:uroporphyrinogen decarboxylase
MVVFAKGAWYALDLLCDLGYQVVGLDWLQDPAEAVKIRGSRPIVFQGNADPGILYGTRENITKVVKEMVAGFGGGKQGWISNLGHGKSSYIYISNFLTYFRHYTRCQPR